MARVAGQVQRGQVHELEEQATFTNPEDQSAWMHCRWLLSRSLALHAAARGAAWEAQAREAPLRSVPATGLVSQGAHMWLPCRRMPATPDWR